MSQNKVITDYFSVSRKPQTQQKAGKGTGDMFFTPEKIIYEDEGRAKAIVNDKAVALIQHNGKIYGIQEKCPHSGGPLYRGDIEDVPGCGPCIKCPWHSWRFSLTTGQCIAPYDHAKRAEVYPVQTERGGEVIKIGFKEFSPKTFNTPPE